MLLSIVVPVYNVETYLRKCVDSLFHQDIGKEEYEIILVDDGSTDTSGVICDEIARDIPNVVVIHKNNGGLSSARNAGIDVASGDFIQFVDSDDYLNRDVLGGLLEQISRQQLDILRFNYQNINAKGEIFEPNKISKPFVDFSSEVCNGLTFLNERLGYACYAVQFIVKASLLKTPSGKFKEGIYFEDVDWTPRILMKAERVSSTDQIVYNYLFRSGSITRDNDLPKKRKVANDQLSLIDSLSTQSQAVLDRRWFDGMTAQTTLSMITGVSRHLFKDRKYYLGELRKKHVFPLSTYHSTPGAVQKIKMANFSPLLLCWSLHMKNGR